MPSFTKRTPTSSNAPPTGTVPSLSSCTPPLHLLPTGIPSLDDLLGGGGLPLGGIWCILAPDRHTSWSRIVERYWIARGLVDGQKGVVVGEKGEEIVRGCMWVDEAARQAPSPQQNGMSPSETGSSVTNVGPNAKTAAGSESEGEEAGLADVSALGENRPKIAWRYDGMQKFQTTLGKGDHGELNLLKPIPASTITSLERQKMQQYIPLEPSASSSSSTSAWSIMSNVLMQLQAIIQKHNDSQALRVTIHSLGDVFWGSPSSAEVLRFTHALRGMVRDRSVGVLITLPPDLARSPPDSKGKGRASDTDVEGDGGEATRAWTEKLAWAVDACLELKGFGDDPSLPPVFHPLHGLLTVHSIPTTHHILPPSYKHSSLLGLSSSSSTSGRGGGAGENNLGFRLGRKRFVVETVHLGIEGGQGERRTEPAPEFSGMVSGVEKPPRPTAERAPGEVDLESPKSQIQAGVSDSPDAGIGSQPALKKRAKGVRFTEADDDPGGAPGRVMARHDKMELYDF